MTKAHYVKRARVARRKYGIKKGQPYWWWQFRGGLKQYSLIQPKPSQLVRSDYLRSILRIQESLFMSTSPSDYNEAADEVGAIGDSLQEKLSGIISNFPNGCPTQGLLESRRDDCDRIAGELRTVANQLEHSDSPSKIDWSTE